MITNTTKKRMDRGFAVFNLHVNNAGERANAEFIAQFGQAAFDKHIQPAYDAGVMSIFEIDEELFSTRLRGAWITLVTAFVNEDRGR